jgi:5-methylcytosine-specific restriction endonuclease McrA
MAPKLPRPCVDCNTLTRSARCIRCKRLKERVRPTPSQRGYGYAWQKLSKEFRTAHPYCFKCGTTKDLTTDHIISKKNGGLSVWSNLQTLCRVHNSEKGSA